MIIDGRLACCVCGCDLGFSEDELYADPSCPDCEDRRLRYEAEQYQAELDAEDAGLQWASEGEAAQHPRERW